MGLRGIRVNGSDYKFDYRYLDNKPEHTIPSIDGQEGKCLVVDNDEIKWGGANAGDYLTALHDSNERWDTGVSVLARTSDGLVWRELIPRYTEDDDNEDRNFLAVVPCGKAWGLDWTSSGIPRHSGTNDGESLCVDDYGNLLWKRILPEYNGATDGSDSGRVLTVSEFGDLEWMEGIPWHDFGDSGKILAVNDHGRLEWANSGDAVFPECTDDDDGKVLKCGGQDAGCYWDNVLPLPGDGSLEYNVLSYDGNNNEYTWKLLTDIVAEVPNGNDSVVGGSDCQVLSVDMTGGGAALRPLWDQEFELTRLLPPFYNSDTGRVPMVVSGNRVDWRSVISLPEFDDYDDGKVPMVVGGNRIQWGSVLPEYGSSDNGKVLTVVGGELKWMTHN